MEDEKRYSETCNRIAEYCFQYTLENGGCEVPMVYLLEMFLTLAAQVASDMSWPPQTTPEVIARISAETFLDNLNLILKEKENKSNLN